MPAIGSGMRVIGEDLCPYRFGGLCKLIAGLLSDLGQESADVLGISWGGGVAQNFAAFQPARCRRLVLVSIARAGELAPVVERFLNTGRTGGPPSGRSRHRHAG